MRILPTIVLLLASNLSQAASNFSFPNPPGPFKVGLRVVHQYDQARAFRGDADPVTGKPVAGEKARPVQTLVWYPASGSGSPMVYGDYLRLTGSEVDFDRSDAQVRRAADIYVRNMYASESGPEQAQEELKGAMRARRDAAPANGKFPVVIYAPSISAPAAENADLCEYLASHGYVVIASPSMGPRSREMPSDLDGAEAGAADIAFLIAYAHTLPHTDPGKVAAMGYSWGGIANVLAAARDSRIKALVDLDGSVRYYPELVAAAKYVTAQTVTAPMLFVAQRPMSLEQVAQRGKPAASFLNEMKYADLYKLTMYPMEHFSFSSTYLRFAPAGRFNQYPRAEVNRAYGWTADYVRHFLDAYLKDDAAARTWLSAAPAQHGIPSYAATMEARLATARPASRATMAAELARRGFDHADEVYQAMRKQDAAFQLKEAELNEWGYALLGAGDTGAAVAILRLATVLYPDSANAYDSLADGFEQHGDKPNAVKNYRRSLQLNPDNANARQHLSALGAPAQEVAGS
jgi:dienelactone hydrolase